MNDDTNHGEFWRALERNRIVATILDRLPALQLTDWYLTGGAVFQTVWNHVSGFDPEHGINDYDLFYCDHSDLDYDAENRVVEQVAATFTDLRATIDVKNQARVHLWYPERFGVPTEPLMSSADGIDRFASTSCCYGVRRGSAGHSQVYAPHGFGDLFSMTLRPNPLQAPRWVYEAKAARWTTTWPALTVLPWPLDLEEPGSDA